MKSVQAVSEKHPALTLRRVVSWELCVAGVVRLPVHCRSIVVRIEP